MANTGKFCFLYDPGVNRQELCRRLGVYVDNHTVLKNLEWGLSLYQGNGANVLCGECDRLTPGLMRDFLRQYCPPGLVVYVVDSTYGDNWERVIP